MGGWSPLLPTKGDINGDVAICVDATGNTDAGVGADDSGDTICKGVEVAWFGSEAVAAANVNHDQLQTNLDHQD